MANSRMILSMAKAVDDSEKPSHFHIPYKPGFIDNIDLETTKVSLDREFGEINKSFYQISEKMSEVITFGEELQNEGGSIINRVESINKDLIQTRETLTLNIKDVNNKTNGRIDEVSVEISETNKALVAQGEVLGQKIEEMGGLVGGDFGKLMAMLEEEKSIRISEDEALASHINRVGASFYTAGAEIDAAVSEEREARVSSDESLAKQITTLKTEVDKGDANLSSQITETNKTLTTLSETMASSNLELKSSISNVQSSASKDASTKADFALSQATTALITVQNMLESAIEDGDEAAAAALKKVKDELEKVIANNKSDIEAKLNITNQTITTLTEAVASNKLELESSITSVGSSSQSALDKAKADLEKAITVGDNEAADKLRKEVDRLQRLMDENQAAIEASLAITNKTVADLDKALAENITSLESKITTSSSGAIDEAISQAQKNLDAAKEALNKAIEDGDTGAAKELAKEVSRLLGIIADNKTDIEAKLSVTNTTIANLDKSVASQITNVQADYNGKFSNVNQEISATVDKLGNVESKWGVTVDANGAVGGVSLIGNSSGSSEFKVNADRFIITNGAQNVKPITIVDGQAAFNNVLIREDCIILGKLYADQVQGLPTGKSFGPIDASFGYNSGLYSFGSHTLTGSDGRFEQSAMFVLRGTSAGKMTSYNGNSNTGAIYVQCLHNGNVVHTAYIPCHGSANCNKFDSFSWASPKIGLGTAGGTLEIRIGPASKVVNGEDISWRYPGVKIDSGNHMVVRGTSAYIYTTADV